MLNQIQASNAAGDVLTISLADISSGVVVEEVGGLDPVKAVIVSSSFAQMDGTVYHSSRREARNIMLKLGLEPDYSVDTVRDIRNRLYKFFMPKSEVNLAFQSSDGPSVSIWGRVESFETSLFSKEPAVDISVMCFDPDFIDDSRGQYSGMTVADSTMTDIQYDGTVETGVFLTLKPDRAVSEVTIYHSPPDGSLRTMDISVAMQAGDILDISTEQGNKFVRLTSAGVTSSVLYALSPQSTWLELQPGLNQLRAYATGTPFAYDLSWSIRYGGL